MKMYHGNENEQHLLILGTKKALHIYLFRENIYSLNTLKSSFMILKFVKYLRKMYYLHKY